jgi:hypothetical protein
MGHGNGDAISSVVIVANGDFRPLGFQLQLLPLSHLEKGLDVRGASNSANNVEGRRRDKEGPATELGATSSQLLKVENLA